MNLNSLWDAISSSEVAGTSTIFRKIAESKARDAFVGIDKVRNQRFFAIDSTGYVARAIDLPAPGGFNVILSSEAITRSGEALYLVLDDDTYSAEFDALIQDVVVSANSAKSDTEVVPKVIETIRRWQRFLEAAKRQGLSAEGQLGLAGELMVIRDFLGPRIGFNSAIIAWKGPMRDSKDFQAGNLAIEVKTSTQARPQTIRISSEFQLDDHSLEHLFLLHNSVERTHGTGESLPELVSSLMDQATQSGVSEHLGNMLLEVGYHSIQESFYQAVRYRPREMNIFKVVDGFPRITEENLPAGVGSLNYSISLAQCDDFKVEDDFVFHALESQ